MTMTEREPELCDFEPQPMDLKPEQKNAEASNSAPLETMDPIASACHEVSIEQYSAFTEDNYVIAEYHDIVEEAPLQSSSSEEGEEDEGIPGGPEDKSLLTSFKQHVAYKIWKGKERPLLKLLHHGNKLEQWDLTKESELFRAKVQASGLSTLALYTYKHISRVLVCAFVERWHPETNTFHLPFGEMTVTLDDVKQILGIPIRGKGFIGSPSIQLDEATRLLQKGLGLEADEINKELAACRGVAVRVGWLKSNLSRRANENDSILDCSVRGYLLYLLGCTLFSDKTGTKVPVVYMRMLMEVDKVHEYAWGACGLAFLYRQLGLATRNNVKQISGYLTLFEAWVREHFRIGGPTPNSTYREEWPRVRRWKSKTSTGDSVAQLIYTREELDSMTAKEVIWDPYGKTREYHEFDEVAFFSGCLMCFDIVEPYHPDRVLRQFSRTQNIPDAPFAPTEVNRPRSGKGYKVVYPVMEQYWARWRNHLLAVEHRGEPVRNPWDCEPEYIEWFRRISHPQVQNPERSTGTQRPVDVSEPILMTQLAEPMLITQLADWRSTKSKALTLLKESLVLGLDQNVSTMLRTMQETYDILSQGNQDDEDATQYLSNGRKEKGIISKQNDKRPRKKKKVDLLET